MRRSPIDDGVDAYRDAIARQDLRKTGGEKQIIKSIFSSLSFTNLPNSYIFLGIFDFLQMS
jgi:hypothetical protein